MQVIVDVCLACHVELQGIVRVGPAVGLKSEPGAVSPVPGQKFFMRQSAG